MPFHAQFVVKFESEKIDLSEIELGGNWPRVRSMGHVSMGFKYIDVSFYCLPLVSYCNCRAIDLSDCATHYVLFCVVELGQKMRH